MTIAEALRAVLIEVLTYHQRTMTGCWCGWSGPSHEAHVADVFEECLLIRSHVV